MSTDDKTVLVLGPTGQQGGSVARALKDDGWRVRALVRDQGKARALQAAGIETVTGDLRDSGSLRDAVKGVYGVFSVQPSSGQPEYGITDADEVRFGVAVADAANEAGVEHLVYSSVAGAGPDTQVGHFDSKWQVEEHVRRLPLDSTVLRPTAFMEILLLPAFGLASGELTFFQKPDGLMQFIAVEDIGRIAAKVFADRATYRGKTFDIAGDAITGRAIADKIGHAVDRHVSYRRFPAEVLGMSPLLLRLVELVDVGPAAGRADLGALRRVHPGLLSFDAWLDRTGRKAVRTIFEAKSA